MRRLLAKIGKALVVVIHDPEVQRTGKAFALKVFVRLVIAAGAGAQLVELIDKLA